MKMVRDPSYSRKCISLPITRTTLSRLRLGEYSPIIIFRRIIVNYYRIVIVNAWLPCKAVSFVNDTELRWQKSRFSVIIIQFLSKTSEVRRSK